MDRFPSVIQNLILDYCSLSDLIESRITITPHRLDMLVQRAFGEVTTYTHLEHMLFQLDTALFTEPLLCDGYIAVVLLNRFPLRSSDFQYFVIQQPLQTRLTLYPHLFKLLNSDGYANTNDYNCILRTEAGQPTPIGVALIYDRMEAYQIKLDKETIACLAIHQLPFFQNRLKHLFITPFIVNEAIKTHSHDTVVHLFFRLMLQQVPPNLDVTVYVEAAQFIGPMIQGLRKGGYPGLYAYLKGHIDQLDYIAEHDPDNLTHTAREYLYFH